jgi:hypothetical protein
MEASSNFAMRHDGAAAVHQMTSAFCFLTCFDTRASVF